MMLGASVAVAGLTVEVKLAPAISMSPALPAVNPRLCTFCFHNANGTRNIDVFVQTHLMDHFRSFTGSDLFDTAIAHANDNKSGVFEFTAEQKSKLQSEQVTLFLRMRGGPHFTKGEFKALQQHQLMLYFTPNHHTVEFDVVVLDNHSDSPVNPNDL